MSVMVCISLSAEFVVDDMHECLMEMINANSIHEIYGNEREIESLIRKNCAVKFDNDFKIIGEIDTLREKLKISKDEGKSEIEKLIKKQNNWAYLKVFCPVLKVLEYLLQEGSKARYYLKMF